MGGEVHMSEVIYPLSHVWWGETMVGTKVLRFTHVPNVAAGFLYCSGCFSLAYNQK